MTAILAGGLTFNIVAVAMPKIIDERLGFAPPLTATGWITTAIFVCGAFTQIAMGRLIDRFELTSLFIWLSVLQPIGLLLPRPQPARRRCGPDPSARRAIYGQVIINDAMVGRYAPAEYRNRVYSVRFFLTFTVGGLAVPIIGELHSYGGFQAVLLVAGGIGAGDFCRGDR